MTTFAVRHTTVYRYSSAVLFGEHRMMLHPRESHDQRVLAFALDISPEPAAVLWSEDPSGNRIALARFGRRGRELRVTATMRVELTAFREDDLAIADYATACPFAYGAEEARDLARFVERQERDPDHAVDRWARALLDGEAGTGTWRFLERLNDTIRSDFAYLRREEPGIQPPAQTLRSKRGSCRDFAVLISEAVRSQGIAARFVSGYLHVRDADERTRHAGGHTHAWLQVYLPGVGWIDFDPTSGAIGNAGLVRVAAVRDPAQASPLSGSYMGFPNAFTGMSVAVEVVRDEGEPDREAAAA